MKIAHRAASNERERREIWFDLTFGAGRKLMTFEGVRFCDNTERLVAQSLKGVFKFYLLSEIQRKTELCAMICIQNYQRKLYQKTNQT